MSKVEQWGGVKTYRENVKQINLGVWISLREAKMRRTLNIPWHSEYNVVNKVYRETLYRVLMINMA